MSVHLHMQILLESPGGIGPACMELEAGSASGLDLSTRVE
jgi:hypothetical protein